MRAGQGRTEEAGDLTAWMAEKESFADAYEAPDPAAYYRGYAPARLSIVEYAAALAGAAVELGVAGGPVVDMGCGYGTLGLLLRTDLDIHAAYSAYLDGHDPVVAPGSEKAFDIVGVDRSAPALQAARGAGFIDRGKSMDLNAPSFHVPEYGLDSIAVCTAVLGYVHPEALRATLDALRPKLTIVTCVTWLMPTFMQAFGRRYTIAKLNRRPLFQRWATAGEERRMAGALIEGAHRAECLLLSGEPLPTEALAQALERVRSRRADDSWLAAGRPDGCEL